MDSVQSVRDAAPAGEFWWQWVMAAERLASVLLLAALSPVILSVGVAVWILSRRSPLIAHRRVGWYGSTLWMLKFRSMWGHESPGAAKSSGLVEYIHDDQGPEKKGESDPRVTSRFARFCRCHSIDEFPQLWHVVKGEMSLVGPRPLTATELERHYGVAASEILQVKPGLAGLWQISGRNALSYAQRRRLDLELVRNRSPRIYLQILLQTVPELLRGGNSW
jgi:exopolysaccharide production protein ExoY